MTLIRCEEEPNLRLRALAEGDHQDGPVRHGYR